MTAQTSTQPGLLPVDSVAASPGEVAANAMEIDSIEASSPEIWLTDEVLFNYQRCPRRVFLDRYGDRQQRGCPPDYLQKLRQDSYLHQREI